MTIQGIILNTQGEFDTLNTNINNWCQVNVVGYNATKWANPIIGSIDGKYLLVIDDRTGGFDFTGYTISNIDTETDTNFFPPIEE